MNKWTEKAARHLLVLSLNPTLDTLNWELGITLYSCSLGPVSTIFWKKTVTRQESKLLNWSLLWIKTEVFLQRIYEENIYGDGTGWIIKSKSVTGSQPANVKIGCRKHFRGQTKDRANLLRSVAKDEQHRIDDVRLSASVRADDTRKVFMEGTQRLNPQKKKTFFKTNGSIIDRST